MTTVTFHSGSGRLDGFVVEGHSGYAEAGSDIVCAAISAAVGLTECTINEVMGLGAPVKAKEESARISLKLPPKLNEASDNLVRPCSRGCWCTCRPWGRNTRIISSFCCRMMTTRINL